MCDRALRDMVELGSIFIYRRADDIICINCGAEENDVLREIENLQGHPWGKNWNRANPYKHNLQYPREHQEVEFGREVSRKLRSVRKNN